MTRRDSRLVARAIARGVFLAAGISAVAAAALVTRRGWWFEGSRARPPRRPTAAATLEVKPRPMASVGIDPGAIRRLVAGPHELDDRRLSPLLRAAASWKRRGESGRRVVDQVCLVPDADAFLEALAEWDQDAFFPILIDEPAWVLPYLRAFRPARVVRYKGRGKPAADILAGWRRAALAVGRAWGPAGFEPNREADDVPRALDAIIPARLQVTSPGVVLSSPGAPMLAGAAALAAGRFQPLILVDPPTNPSAKPGDPTRAWDYATVPGLVQAWDFVHAIEARISIIRPRHELLGDDCDFITVAGDWPYRFRVAANQFEPGEYALDDFMGRIRDRDESSDWLTRFKGRWAFVGRLTGDPAASVAHAMASLFLQPTTALLWDTYDHNRKRWIDYNLNGAALRFAHMLGGSSHVVARDGDQATLNDWHAAIETRPHPGLVFLNSTGSPDGFTISGGPGRPADLPSGTPCAVAMIHSFSAADPADPATIAGRWLSQGAYVYFGAMNEPFLLSFRRPRLVAKLIEAGVPFAAALREGDSEVYGHPWRMVFLGDPLYRIEPRLGSNGPDGGRESVGEWIRGSPGADTWPLQEVARAPTIGDPGDADRLLADSLDAAILETLSSQGASSAAEWIERLRRVSRASLAPARRRVFDELVIDVLRERAADEPLWDMLSTIPPGERGERVWSALEGCAFAEFARASMAGTRAGFAQALETWEKALRVPWPPESRFPEQITQRAGDLARNEAGGRLGPWRERLRQAARLFPVGSKSATAIAAELARIEGAIRP